MRPRYLLVGFENVHCLKAGIFDTKALRTCGKPSEAARPVAQAQRRVLGNSHLAEREFNSFRAFPKLPVVTDRSWPSPGIDERSPSSFLPKTLRPTTRRAGP